MWARGGNMDINKLLNDKKINKSQLSKLSNVPYTTVNELCNNKTEIKNCKVDTVYKIAKVLGVSIEDLLLDDN